MITAAGNYSIAPFPQTLTTGQMYNDDTELLLNGAEQVRLVTTGSVDYLFNISNTNP